MSHEYNKYLRKWSTYNTYVYLYFIGRYCTYLPTTYVFKDKYLLSSKFGMVMLFVFLCPGVSSL